MSGGSQGVGRIFTTITIYNIRGQRVRTLVDGYKVEGEHSVEWDGRDEAGNRVSSGVYFYRMRAGDISQTRRMVLMK
jgi:flagellar hook assembly protein FlgD